MKRLYLPILVLGMWLCGYATAMGQYADDPPDSQLPLLLNHNYHISEDTLHIDFTITHEANLEFCLKDEEGGSIWATQYLKDKGSHRISLNLAKLEERGNNYSYSLVYKGTQHEQDFSF